MSHFTRTIHFIFCLFPQAFGNQEGIQREPSPGEERAMVYTAVIAGATGIIYFTREDSDATPPVAHG